MDGYQDGEGSKQQRNTGNAWGASVPHCPLGDCNDPPTDGLALQRALSAWKRVFGDGQFTLGIQDTVPLEQGPNLGSGGLGVVYETKIDGIPVAWKRIYSPHLTESHQNEVKILARMTKNRHRHIVSFIGSYIHRQRNNRYELAILTWPVAVCDLSVLFHEVDLVAQWESRDKASAGETQCAPPTEEEQAAYNNLLRLEQIHESGPRQFTRHSRRRALDQVRQRLRQSIGCIAEAVQYLHHHKIRHKDIKPSQILLSHDGLWLTDFGWSKDVSHLASSGTSNGERTTARYHAPERAQMGKCGRSEDIFALGCTYLEMGFRIYGLNHKDYLNPGKLPMWSFQGDLDAIDSWLSPFISEEDFPRSSFGILVKWMMARSPGKRIPMEAVLIVMRMVSSRWAGSFFHRCCIYNSAKEVHHCEAFDHVGAASNTKQSSEQPGYDKLRNSEIDSIPRVATSAPRHPILHALAENTRSGDKSMINLQGGNSDLAKEKDRLLLDADSAKNHVIETNGESHEALSSEGSCGEMRTGFHSDDIRPENPSQTLQKLPDFRTRYVSPEVNETDTTKTGGTIEKSRIKLSNVQEGFLQLWYEDFASKHSSPMDDGVAVVANILQTDPRIVSNYIHTRNAVVATHLRAVNSAQGNDGKNHGELIRSEEADAGKSHPAHVAKQSQQPEETTLKQLMSSRKRMHAQVDPPLATRLGPRTQRWRKRTRGSCA